MAEFFNAHQHITAAGLVFVFFVAVILVIWLTIPPPKDEDSDDWFV